MSIMGSVRCAPLLALTAIVVASMGLGLTGGGVWLAALGGSSYYLIAGVVLLVTAWLLVRRRAEALLLYAALLLGTMIWAVYEAGLDFWSLAPRGDVLAPLGVWLLLPFIASHLAPRLRVARWALAAVLAVAVVVLGASLSSDRRAIAGTLPSSTTTVGASSRGANAPASAAEDWTAYGGTGFGTRYSALDQINKDNVKNLKLAWEFR